MRTLLLPPLPLLLLLAGCAGGGNTYSCDFRNATSSQEERCQERSIDPITGSVS
jgi:hypothetical protein